MVLDTAQDQDGAEPAGDNPLRQCAVTRQQLPQDDLIRFVAAPDGSIVPDLARKLPGRGVWVTATRQAVEQAVRTKAFSRSLKRQVTAAPDLAENVERLLTKRLLQAISLANKAGQIVTGFTKVDALVGAGQALALVQARDAAEDGRQKLDRKLRAVASAAGREPVVLEILGIEELSLAIGRENVVHAALVEGGASRRVIEEAGRLQRYRSGAGTS